MEIFNIYAKVTLRSTISTWDQTAFLLLHDIDQYCNEENSMILFKTHTRHCIPDRVEGLPLELRTPTKAPGFHLGGITCGSFTETECYTIYKRSRMCL